MSKYGAIVTGEDVHQGVVRFLQEWSPSYIAEVGRQAEFTTKQLPNFRSYLNIDSMDKWPEKGTPAVITFIPGMADEPVREGSGLWRAKWLVGVGVMVKGPDLDATRRLLMCYLAAVRTLFIQKPSMDGFAESVRWIGEDYDLMDTEAARTLRAGAVNLEIEVNSVADSHGGLPTPPTNPAADPGDFGTVQSAIVETRKLQR